MSTEPIRILVIDDSEDDRLLYQRTLQKNTELAYHVWEAREGEEGLRCIKEEKPACVLLDYSLPGHDGIEILKRIRSQYPFLPIVMLTGQGNETVAANAIREGAQHYIAKSTITSETLESVIRMAIQHCALQKRIHEQRVSLEVFTRALAHDLKEPIRTIRSFVDLIVQREAFSEKTREHFHHIQSAADRMYMLIDSVFFYTRLDAPDQATREICELNEVVREVQDNLTRLVQDRSTTIHSSALPRVHINRTQLMQVLQNLIGNAIQHSTTPVTIHVDATEKPEYWLLRVSDNGPGIDEAYLQKIFEPFRRLSNREMQGAGLGLAICQRIIESHGGTIWCESPPGQGASFIFTLPKALPSAETDAPSAEAPAAAPITSAALASVLLVDDNKADRDIARFMLVDGTGLRCNLLMANGSKEALAILKAGTPEHQAIDLMLIDINMPGMDGFELLETMSKDQTLRHTKVVMCTGSIHDKDRERSRALGAIGYLTKPVDFAKFKSIINTSGIFQLRQKDNKYFLLRAA